MPNQFNTREEWLNFVTDEVRPLFKERGFPLPKDIRMAVGFTSNGYRGKAIGECWDASASGDKHIEIFVKPDQDEALRVADILVHELCHAAVGTEHGHKLPFKRAAIAMGLTGKMTATEGGPEFEAYMCPILKRAGKLPHKALVAYKAKKKQGTRLLKCECPDCGYVVRTTAKWLDKGSPLCPDGLEMVCEEIEGEEDE